MIPFFIFLASVSFASDFPFTRKTNPTQLSRELKAAGFAVNSVECNRSSCLVRLADGERKNPSAMIAAHVPMDDDASRKSMLDELASIEAKADADITIDELRRAFRLMMKLQGFSRQP